MDDPGSQAGYVPSLVVKKGEAARLRFPVSAMRMETPELVPRLKLQGALRHSWRQRGV